MRHAISLPTPSIEEDSAMPAMPTSASPEDTMDVLFYEVQMLNHAFDVTAPSIDLATNAKIELFLLHLRNLVYFFYEKPKQDDISVIYFNDKHGFRFRLDTSPTGFRKEDMNKHLSHKTSRRIDTKTHWPCRDLLKKMNQQVEEFINMASDSYFPTKGGRLKQHFFQEISDLTRLVSVPISTTSSTYTSTIIVGTTVSRHS
jgi:hypothetical protein